MNASSDVRSLFEHLSTPEINYHELRAAERQSQAVARWRLLRLTSKMLADERSFYDVGRGQAEAPNVGPVEVEGTQ